MNDEFHIMTRVVESSTGETTVTYALTGRSYNDLSLDELARLKEFLEKFITKQEGGQNECKN